MSFLPDLSGLRPKQRCNRCNGAWQSNGPESRWVPHQPGCPRGPKNVEAHGGEERTIAQTGRREDAADRPIGTGPASAKAAEPGARMSATPRSLAPASTTSDADLDSPWEPVQARRTTFPRKSWWEPQGGYDIGSGADE